MAQIWANQIIKGKKTFKEVPRLLKQQVRQILINRGYNYLIIE